MPITRPPHGNDLRKLGVLSELLKVSAQNTPNLTVRINRGGFWKDEQTFVETPDVNTTAMTPPVANARYDLVCIRDNGLPIVVSGIASASPDLPAVPPKYLPLAAVYVQAGVTSITNEAIYDLRPFFRAGTPPGDHQLLQNRNPAEAAHTITAITGLQSALDTKTSLSDVNLLLNNKADVNGTNSESFTLNKDQTGVGGPDVYLMVERGSEANTGFRWNETAEVWEFTNDGTLWQSFNSPDLSPGIITYTHLAAPLQTLIDDKAEEVHTHNDLYYTEAETDSLLVGKAAAAHTHSTADITSGQFLEARLPDNINPTKLANGTISTTEFERLNGVTSNIQTQLDGKAAVIHVHDGADITTGTIGVARIPTGIDAVKLADGTVSNTELQYINSLTSNAQDQIDGKADTIHAHDATDITTGILDVARIPALIDAAKISTGVVSNAEFDYLNGVTSDIQTQLNGKAATVHTHDGADITTGTIAAARLPLAIDAANLADGTVSNAELQFINSLTSNAQTQINGKADTVHTHAQADVTGLVAALAGKAATVHTHDAADTTTGTFAVARIPSGIDATNIASGTVSNAVFSYLVGVTSAIQTQINGKAATAHTHAAADVTSGTFAVARIPTGIDAANISGGLVSNTEFDYLNGVTSDIQTQINGKAATVHTHAASDTTSGTFAVARIPTGISAANISSGTISDIEFDYLNGVTSNIQTQFTGKADKLGSVDIEITSNAAGVILTSSPGNVRWRIIVSDAGALSTVAA